MTNSARQTGKISGVEILDEFGWLAEATMGTLSVSEDGNPAAT